MIAQLGTAQPLCSPKCHTFRSVWMATFIQIQNQKECYFTIKNLKYQASLFLKSFRHSYHKNQNSTHYLLDSLSSFPSFCHVARLCFTPLIPSSKPPNPCNLLELSLSLTLASPRLWPGNFTPPPHYTCQLNHVSKDSPFSPQEEFQGCNLRKATFYENKSTRHWVFTGGQVLCLKVLNLFLNFPNVEGSINTFISVTRKLA